MNEGPKMLMAAVYHLTVINHSIASPVLFTDGRYAYFMWYGPGALLTCIIAHVFFFIMIERYSAAIF